MENKRMIPGIEPVNDFNALKVIFKVLWFPLSLAGKAIMSVLTAWFGLFTSRGALNDHAMYSDPGYSSLACNIHHDRPKVMDKEQH